MTTPQNHAIPTAEQVDAAEASIDAAWRAVPLPSQSIDHCFFQLLTQQEDLQRFAFAAPDPVTAYGVIDSTKYALRTAMLLARSRTRLIGGGRYSTSEVTYTAASSMLLAAGEYETARAAFSLYRRGDATCQFIDDVAVLAPNSVTHRHDVMDLLVQERGAGSVYETFSRWCDGSGNCPGALRTIARNVRRIDDDRISYKFVPKLATQLARKLPSGHALLPDSWQAWGLPSHVIRAILRAIKARCIYHVISVDRGARRYDIVGGAVDDLLLVVERETLVQQISAVSECNSLDVERLLSALTYGSGTSSPDPVLQPVVGLDATRVALPCYLVLSSRIERNLLTLQARVAQKEFDSQSGIFADNMQRELAKVLKSSGYASRMSQASSAGEIDVLLGQRGCDQLIVLELKWGIPPGDYREVLDRRSSVQHGAQQVERKRGAVAARIPHFCQLLDIDTPVVRVVGFLLCRGFSDAPANSSVRCIPFHVAKKVLGRRLPLERVIGTLLDEEWLPVPTVHFNAVQSDHMIGETRFAWRGYQITPQGWEHCLAWSQ